MLSRMRATVRSADKTSKQLRKKLARSAQRKITRKRRGANLDEISVQFVQFIGLVPVVVASHSDANLLSELHIALNSQLLPAREDGEKPRYAFRCQEATDGSCLILAPRRGATIENLRFFCGSSTGPSIPTGPVLITPLFLANVPLPFPLFENDGCEGHPKSGIGVSEHIVRGVKVVCLHATSVNECPTSTVVNGGLCKDVVRFLGLRPR